ncbi:HAD-IA family hydrolase [Dermacoccus sp. PAMC28757]|uniref:HAD-IA family hydrolase n=1 Tax=Dermacoccus TaxID=57495 RepID=UPI00164DCF8F|nr:MULTISPECIES: HAD-IA family hydrolase [Dermacoccus]QNK52545.1 HAD-IA family hydrolase [Dermacoccus sp. PAMC28757]
MHTPRAILWDADGVLQRIPLDTWDLAVSVVSQIPGALTGAKVDEAAIRTLAHDAGLDDRVRDVLSVWWTFDLIHAALDIVARLRDQGIASYLASNQDSYRAACMRERTLYGQVLDGAYYSCDLGVAKPSTAFFNHIASDLSVPHNELLFIDDHPANVTGARSAGLNAECWTHTDGIGRLLALLAAHEIRLT